MVVEQTGIFKRLDSLRGDRSKRNQNKYCQFHKDIGHTTEECITLKDEIEKIIRLGYLQDYINDRRTRPQNDRPEAEPPREIRTILDLILPGKCMGSKTVTFERRRRGHSPMSTTWISSLQNNSRGRTMTSLLEKVMHTLSTTPIVTPWSSQR